jgi:hypothetical protein
VSKVRINEVTLLLLHGINTVCLSFAVGVGVVRSALRVALETGPDCPASSADDVPLTTPQDRERAPELGPAPAALSIPHFPYAYHLLFSFRLSLLSLSYHLSPFVLTVSQQVTM